MHVLPGKIGYPMGPAYSAKLLCHTLGHGATFEFRIDSVKKVMCDLDLFTTTSFGAKAPGGAR